MKPNRKRSIIFTIAMVLYLAVVGYLLFANFEKLSSVPKIFLGIPTDKIVHFCMFFPFPILAYLAYDRLTDTPLKALAALVFSDSAALERLDAVMQPLILGEIRMKILSISRS